MSISELEEQIDDFYGINKMKGLLRLTEYYQPVKLKKAIRYGRQSVTLGENILIAENKEKSLTEQELLLKGYFLLGQTLFLDENYLEARKNFSDCLKFGEEIGSLKYANGSQSYLNSIQNKINSGEVKDNFFNRTISQLKVGQALNEAGTDFSINAEINLGQVKEKKGELKEAVGHYNKAINLLKNKGDEERIAELRMKVAVLLDSLNEYEASKEILDEALSQISDPEENSDSDSITLDGKFRADKDNNLDSLKYTRQKLRELSDEYAARNDYKKSLEYLQLYQNLSMQMRDDSIRNVEESKRASAEIQLLKQQKQIADLKIRNSVQEKQKEIRIRNLSIAIAITISIGLLFILYFYLSKRKQHRELIRAYSDLDIAKKQLEKAEKRIVHLLSQQVSSDIASELISNEAESEGKRHFVCIMFLDVRGFTPIAETMSPEQLIQYQNKLFGFMIDIIDENSGIINQFVGDGFMATFGAPKSHGNDCQNALNAAKEILSRLSEKVNSGEIRKTRIGIGLHAGNVVTGNVGTETRKQYSVTGNTVITASRIEQLNKEFNSQLIISEEVYVNLDDKELMNPEFREVIVKGRSKPVRIINLI